MPAGIELNGGELREVAGYAAACARRVLPLFERDRPDDPRPRAAIDAADAFAAGARRTGALRQHAWAAYRAAQEVGRAAAAAAARSASHAAAAAFLHPLADAHQVKHVLGAAAHAARAVELASAAPDRVDRDAPAAVVAVLRRLPPAPPGGGRVGELLRDLDAALRGPPPDEPDHDPDRWCENGPGSH